MLSLVQIQSSYICSHWWGEPIFDFVQCCEAHHNLRRLSTDQDSYWVCAYANRQHSLEEDISDNPQNSAFWKAINVAEGVLLVLDSEATPFGRIWCDFELHHALVVEKPLDIITVRQKGERRDVQLLSQEKLPGETLVTKTQRESAFPATLLVKGITSNMQDGAASHIADKEQILECMAKNSHTGRDDALQQANGLLHAYLALAAWPIAVKKGCVENISPGLSLARVVKEGPMQNFSLSLSHIRNMSDADLQVLAKCFLGSASLQSVDLRFEGCAQITDTGFTELVRSFPGSVRNLSLDCVGCRYISDIGLKELARSLQPKEDLQVLDLHFAKCPGISLEGISMLSDALPRTLKKFNAGFEGTQVNCKFNSAKDMEKIIISNGRTTLSSQILGRPSQGRNSLRNSLSAGSSSQSLTTATRGGNSLRNSFNGGSWDFVERQK